MRAEVTLLSRNVTIQGDADSVDDGYDWVGAQFWGNTAATNSFEG